MKLYVQEQRAANMFSINFSCFRVFTLLVVSLGVRFELVGKRSALNSTSHSDTEASAGNLPATSERFVFVRADQYSLQTSA